MCLYASVFPVLSSVVLSCMEIVSARGASPILTALITCVRLSHMWSLARWSDSWD